MKAPDSVLSFEANLTPRDFQTLREALAAERRATVEPERIARAIRAASLDFDFYDERQTDKAAAWISEYLLDEEAAR